MTAQFYLRVVDTHNHSPHEVFRTRSVRRRQLFGRRSKRRALEHALPSIDSKRWQPSTTYTVELCKEYGDITNPFLRGSYRVRFTEQGNAVLL